MSTWSSVRRVALAAFGLLAVVLSGCGGEPRRSASRAGMPLPPDTLQQRMREVGRHGGRFVIGQTSSPKTFNPHLASGSSTTDVTTQLFAGLVDIDYHSYEDIPLLARSWDVSDDHLTYTFHLRRGACFSDGHPITSEDVLFSFQVMLDDSLELSSRSLLIAGDRPFEVSAPDSFTFVVKLAALQPTALPSIGAVRILPKHKLESAYREGRFLSAYGTNTRPESLVTSGAWTLKAFEQDQKTVLAPNPYWVGVDAKGQRLPYLDELVFLIGKDQATLALRFHAGEVDGIDNVKPEDYADYDARAKAEAYTLYELGPSLNTNFLFFNLNLAKAPGRGRRVGEPVVGPAKYSWFSDREFRRALSLAVDRDALIKGPFYGHAVKNFTLFTVANKLWHTPDVRKDDYDPEQAKALLAGRGFRDRDGDGVVEDPQGRRVSFTIKTNGDNNVRMGMATLVQEDLRRIGIEANVQGVDFRALTTNLQDDFGYEACLLGLQTSVPPDPGMAGSVLRSNGTHHYWHPKQARPVNAFEQALDEAFGKVNATADYAPRKAAVDEIQRMLNEESIVIWLPAQIMRLPVRSRFGNVDPSIMPHRILWNADRIFEKSPGPGR